MAVRRELLPLLLTATFVLAGPGEALAAPQFVPSEPLTPAGAAADVTTDQAGNAAAAWNAGGHILVAQRPRGGPWGAAEDLTAPNGGASRDPRIVVLPDGELVVAWQVVSDVLAATRPPGGDWSGPQTIGSDCCAELDDAVAGADGTALVFWNSADGTAATAVKPPGAAAFEPPQGLSLNLQPAKVAVAADGSALAVARGDCGVVAAAPCIRAQFRPPGRTWGNPETAALTGTLPRGLGLAARPGSRPFTVAWGETDGTVHSADRTGAGAWAAAIDVQAAPTRAPAGCPSGSFGCVDLASRDDGLAVVWQSGGAVDGSVRSGTGAWSGAEAVGAAGTGDSLVAAAMAAEGTALAAWQANAGVAGAVVRGAHRDGGGAWQQDELGRVSAVGARLGIGDVAADGQGDGLAGFLDVDGSRVAGFDSAGPRFTAFSLPSGGGLTFSAAAADNWSGPASISWLFGDGTGASGPTVAHAYDAAGTFTATATATDAVGNTTQQSGPVFVTRTVTPDPCGTADADRDGIGDGCDESNGARRPRPFRTVNATVVAGDGPLGLPTGSAGAAQAKPPGGFVPLEGAETIPVGSTLDTGRGRVKIRSAANTGRKTQTGQFFRGRFVIRQLRIKRRSKKLITDMRLNGSSFRKACGTTTASASQRRRRSRKRVRRLFGDAKGSFRTSGRNAAATVRGTRWGVQDRCDGTLVVVQRGRVEVRDKVRRKTIVLRTGRSYLARRR